MKVQKTRRRLSKKGGVTLLLMFLFVVMAAFALAGWAENRGPVGPLGQGSAAAPVDGETLHEAEALAGSDARLKTISEHPEEYTEALVRLAVNCPEARDFVVNYPEKKGTVGTIDLTEEAASDKVPLLLQWDERWGYHIYGAGVIGTTGCGPTALSMVALYLTGDPSYDPVTVADYAESAGYSDPGNGTQWTLMSEGCRAFGLIAEELPLDEERMRAALIAERPVICAMGPGDFTETGHFIVLTGLTEEGFVVNDPNSIERSERAWTYEEISGQIRNIWAFDKAPEYWGA